MAKVVLAIVTAAVIMLLAGMATAQQHGHGGRHAQDGKQHHGGRQTATGAADTRVLVKFPPMMIEHTLANMRDHLAALKEINDALAQGENGKAAEIAEQRLGMSSLKAHGAQHVAEFMPQGMRDVGTQMHRAASRFALEAQNADVTGDLKKALGALGEVMSACVGCHAGYRLK